MALVRLVSLQQKIFVNTQYLYKVYIPLRNLRSGDDRGDGMTVPHGFTHRHYVRHYGRSVRLPDI